jgi:hypothetical protein
MSRSKIARKDYWYPILYKTFQEEWNKLSAPHPKDYPLGYPDPSYKLDYDLFKNKIKELLEAFKLTIIAENGLGGNEKAELLYDIVFKECLGGLRNIEEKFKRYCVIIDNKYQ